MVLLALLLIVIAVIVAVAGFLFGDLIIAILAIVLIAKAVKKRKGKGSK